MKYTPHSAAPMKTHKEQEGVTSHHMKTQSGIYIIMGFNYQFQCLAVISVKTITKHYETSEIKSKEFTFKRILSIQFNTLGKLFSPNKLRELTKNKIHNIYLFKCIFTHAVIYVFCVWWTSSRSWERAYLIGLWSFVILSPLIICSLKRPSFCNETCPAWLRGWKKSSDVNEVWHVLKAKNP